MLSCIDLLAELSNLLDNEVPAGLRRNLEEHIAECKICTVLYDSTSKTVRIVTDSGSFDLPDAVASRMRSRVMDAIRSGRRSSSSD